MSLLRSHYFKSNFPISILNRNFSLFTLTNRYKTITVRKPKKRRGRDRKFKILGGSPARKAIVVKVMTRRPKKPNSAQRKVVICKLTYNNKSIVAFIPGEGHSLQTHSVIMVQPGRKKDINTNFVAIRGVYDLAGVEGRSSSKSKYGSKKVKTENK